MKPDRFLRIRELLVKVNGLTPEERRRVLGTECAGDPELLREVESLIAYDEKHDRILPSSGRISDALADRDEERTASRHSSDLPRTIAGYRILRRLGIGGMGEVFLAEQERGIRRRVALKIIKPGMDSSEVIARFESERQALAVMSHPNIADVYDAGTTEEGRPYFVMELVEGIPITTYCDQHHVSTDERLALFIPVCRAIDHAHEKSIIHRDIKPSNILVTVQSGEPMVKIIDFGISKATNQRLTERTIFTEQGRLIGTPEYMSPEQAAMSGLGVDTRTDIYSLGVLLYELLTGALPFDRTKLRLAGFEEMLRIIREVDPPTPSARISSLGLGGQEVALNRGTEADTLIRSLKGDLDWIILKAMAKDRTRRYWTAHDLASDIDRHLKGDAVLARPPTFGYRLNRTLRKHRLKSGPLILSLLAVVTIALVAVIFFSNLGQNARGELLAVEVFQGENARAVSDRGDILWVRRLPGRIVPNGNPEDPRRPQTVVEANGRPIGTVLSTWPDTEAGCLWFLDAATGQIRWSRKAEWGTEPINLQGPSYYEWNVLVDWPGLDSPLLALGLRDGDWYSYSIQFVTLDNELLGSYFHPGPLMFCEQVSMADGATCLLLHGTNSSARFIRRLVPFETAQHPGCVVLLDLANVNGQAFPHSADLPVERDWPGMTVAHERNYLLIPPIHPSLGARANRLYVKHEEDGGMSIQVMAYDGRIITLDESLKPIGCYMPLNSRAHELNQRGEAVFLPCLLIRDGEEEFIDVPMEQQ